jgi:DNA-binding transcriptional ArsR family regulator
VTPEKAPRKPRLHDPRCVRWPKSPLRLGVFRFSATRLLERLQDRELPPSLAAIIERPDKANRSDGLDSIWRVVACLLAFTSLKSFRVGFRQRRGHGFDLVGLAVASIAAYTDLDESTVSHVLTLLRKAGYVHGPGRDGVNVIKQPWETLAGGELAPLPAVRRFSFVFFAELGLGSLIALKRAGTPAPATPAATVHPSSAAKLIAALAVSKGAGPPE